MFCLEMNTWLLSRDLPLVPSLLDFLHIADWAPDMLNNLEGAALIV